MSTYMIVNQPTREKLEDRINELLKQGWTPVGGVFVDERGYNIDNIWLQAMIKTS